MSLDIKHLLEKASKELKKHHIITARLDAEILLMHILKISKTNLICSQESILPNDKANQYLELIKIRCTNKPISQIIGEREFYSEKFYVNENTLDPRPDSETIIIAAEKHFKKNDQISILDLGTGTGCLAITLLKLFPNSTATAIDINPETLKITKKNRKLHNLEKQLTIKLGNWNNNLSEKFDLIISNPPYIRSTEISKLQADVKLHEPHIALDGGEDGLQAYRQIALNILKNCKEKTKIILEIGEEQEDQIIKIFENNKFKYISNYKDLAGIIRCLAFSAN
jgi:release factor glutamine methyltransferase